MQLGIVADAHGLIDEALTRALAGVDLILHAGDVGGRAVLVALSRVAPV